MNKFQRLVGIGTVLAVLATIVSLLPSQLQAQTTYGSIVGTVTDASAAAVPGATVTVTNLGTNDSRTIKSDAAGNYSAVNLLPATYKIAVEATNFKHFVRQPVPVAVGATMRIDIALQVGAATETVEVTTQAPLLQTDSSSMSQAIEGKTVQEMPLNGRNSMNLLALAPGVIPGGSTGGSAGGNQGAGHTNVGGFGNYQMGGGLSGQSQMFVDGAPVNTLGGNLTGNVTALIPTQDAIQEFNVSSNNVSAEFGRFGSGVVNMATKGGTNAFHGAVYEYIRNRAFNANEWFNKRSQLLAGKANKTLAWNQNQYGLAVGGPVLKDKAFFHFTWEKFHSNNANTNPSNVPDANMQGGTVPRFIKDPLNCPDPTNAATCLSITYYNSSGTVVTPNSATSPANVAKSTIKSAYFDPMAAVMKNYYPLPNNSLAVGQNNWSAAPATPDSQEQYNARIDYNLSARQRLFARYTHWVINDEGYNELGNYQGWLTENAKSLDYVDHIVLGDTITLSPKTILDLRLAYLRNDSPNSTVASLGMDYSKYPSNSFANQLVNSMTAKMIVQYTFGTAPGVTGYNFYSFNRCCSIGHDWYNNYTVSASLIQIIGNHNVKIGGMITRLGDHSIAGGNSGSFSFNGQYTGDQWSDFLLGYETNSSSLTTQGAAYGYNYYQGYYITDTWQVSKKLTLNLGLRWELPGGIYSGHDYNTVLLPDATDPTYNTKGTLALVNSSLYASQSSINVKHDLFAPRIGFAYRLNNNTVVSGGYGISYMPIDVQTGGMPVKSPNISNPNACGSVSTTTPNPAQLLYNCFNASNPIVGPPLRQSNYFTLLKYYENTGKAMNNAYPYQKYPYTQQWNLSVARQLPSESMIQVSYVGAAGLHLPLSGWNYNQIPSGSYNSSGLATTGPQAGQALTAKTGTCGTTTTLTVGQCLRPYPHYGNMRDTLAYRGQTIYHSLQLRGEKRFGAGGTLMGNFTWAKMIGDTDTQLSFLENGTGGPNSGGGGAPNYQDYTNLRGERSVLTYDVPYRAVFSYILNMPFGKGQRWGANASPVLNRVISGWGINGITTLQHGFRLPMKTSGNAALASTFGTGTIRPNYTAGCSKASPLSGNARIAQWFNNTCWTAAPAYTFGNEPRVDSGVFAQGIKNFDLSFLKSTQVTERIAVQFRAEFFNVFNRKQWAQPDTSIGSSTYGQVLATNNQPRLGQFSLRVNF